MENTENPQLEGLYTFKERKEFDYPDSPIVRGKEFGDAIQNCGQFVEKSGK